MKSKIIGILWMSTIIVGCSGTKSDPYIHCTNFDNLDSEILSLMDQVRSKHKGNRIFLKAFEMEQVYWIQYRDRRLRSIYPLDWSNHYRKKYGKDVFNPCKCKELERLAEKRIEDLEMYIKGGPSNQDDCPSMLNEEVTN
jgi:Tfp pilus assembly protein PilP